MNTTTSLIRDYKASYTFAKRLCNTRFSVILECQQNPNCFHMMIEFHGSFLNWSINICNWPIKEWSFEQMKECVRIFEEEYLPACRKLSKLVDNQFYVNTTVIHSFTNGNIIQKQKLDTNDTAKMLWEFMNNTSEKEIEPEQFDRCSTCRPENDIFGVCSSIHDAGYLEDPYPFVGAINAFGDSVESNTSFYKKYLPTLYNLSLI